MAKQDGPCIICGAYGEHDEGCMAESKPVEAEKIQLMNLHGTKTHKAIPHAKSNTGWVPLCRPNVWRQGLFGQIQVLHRFEGTEDQIDCKVCLTKMGRR